MPPRYATTAAFEVPLANVIWKGYPWSFVIKEAVDGLVYALLTARTFGWRWPH